MVWLQASVVALAVSGPGDTVLLDFYADWCGPCQQMDATVRQLAAKGYPVRRINVDEHPDLVAKYRIRPIPCFVMVVGGREVARETGMTGLQRLEQMCKMGAAAPSTGSRAGKSGAPTPKTAGGLTVPVVQLGSPAPPSALTGRTEPKTPAAPPAQPPATPAGWRLTPAAQTGPKTAGADADARLLACSVRLRIADPDGFSCGSGTIIDAREGLALILTCGHIFRDSQGSGRIEVDLFGPHPAQKVPGRLLRYDEKRDVGLLLIRTPGPVAVARVAPRGYRVQKGDAVVSTGCNHGADPTARHSHIADLNKYVGPPNLEIDDQPVEGRSGGGLFTPDGLLIGVCNAADPADREGLFAALGAIHAELDEANLAFVYQDIPSMPKQMPTGMPAGMPTEMPAQMPAQMPAEVPGATPAAMAAATPPLEKIPVRPTASRVDTDRGQPPPLRPEEQAAWEEIRRRKAEGAEVICIIRSLRDPQAETQILVLDRASPTLLDRLAAEAHATQMRQTSLAVSRGRAGGVRSAGAGSRIPLPSPFAQPDR